MVISSWIKNHSTSSNNSEYEHFCVAGLPDEPAADGMRVGHIHEMAAKGVCAESTLAVSGHDPEKLSALWHTCWQDGRRHPTASSARGPLPRPLAPWPKLA